MFIHASSQSFAGVAADHLPALYALTLLPLLILAAGRAVRIAAAAGAGWARVLLEGWRRAAGGTRLAVILMAATAVVHLGLIPGHAEAAPTESQLFLVDAILFIAVSLLAVGGHRIWRPAAAFLLVATIGFYGASVASEREHVDDLGVVTKMIELAAFGLVVMPRARPARTGRGRRLRWVASGFAVVLLTTTSGALAWGASLRDGVGMNHQPEPSSPPSAAQRLAAQKFAEASWAGIAGYGDVSAARAAGYRPTTPPGQATVHYLNAAYSKHHLFMDARRPEGLVYTGGPHPVLLGAMFELGGQDRTGNSFGGAVPGWHVHANVCVSAFLDLGGLTTPYGNCPPLSFNITTNPMLHVWRPENPKGQFGELDEKWAKRVATAGGVA